MKLVAVHLWKEWREHRAALGFLALALPLVIACPAFLMRPRLVATPSFALGAVFVAVLAVLVGVGGALLGHEARGAGPRWLERLPRALGGAFAAKTLFFVATTAGAALLGLAVAIALTRIRGRAPQLRLEQWSGRWALLVCAVVMWTFAASPWARRGGLALLGGCVALALLALPAEILSRNGYLPASWEVMGFRLLLLGTAPVSAWYAFGARGGLPRWRAAARALTPAALSALVPWSALAHRWSQRAVDPGSGGFECRRAFVSLDGRCALVAGTDIDAPWFPLPSDVLRVDLEDGSWKRVTDSWESMMTMYLDDAIVECEVASGQEFRCFDARDGVELTSCVPGAADGARRAAGLGMLLSGDGDAEIHDPFRNKSYSFAQLFPGMDSTWLQVLVLPGSWLVESYDAESSWSWFDPSSSASIDTGWGRRWDDSIQPEVVFPDGRVLLKETCPADETDAYAWLVLDPRSGAYAPVTLDGERYDWGMLDNAYAPVEWRATVFDSGPAFLLTGFDSVYRLDPRTCSLHPIQATPDEQFLRSFEDGAVILIDREDRLVRLQLDTGEREVLFPRAEGAAP